MVHWFPKHRKKFIAVGLLAFSLFLFGSTRSEAEQHFGAARIAYKGASFDTFVVDPEKERLEFHLTDDKGRRFGTIEAVRHYLLGKNRTLLFATNGGMFNPLFEPNGLFMENGMVVYPLDNGNAKGNFYLKPNGVFYLSESGAHITVSENFEPYVEYIHFATQSGPMLVIDGAIHEAFSPASESKFIRSGVGVTKGGQVVFAISNEKVNFYHFAEFFQTRMSCENALFLDGAISKMYLPQLKREELDGDFAVVITVSR